MIFNPINGEPQNCIVYYIKSVFYAIDFLIVNQQEKIFDYIQMVLTACQTSPGII